MYVFIEFPYKRQIYRIADTICLWTTNLLSSRHILLTDNKFAELFTKFSEIRSLLIVFADDEKPCCQLKWINNIAEILASRLSEHQS
jgi:hypothetical protein